MTKERKGDGPESASLSPVENFDNRFEESRASSMLHWWPKVKDLGVPVPKTEIVLLTSEELREWWDKDGRLPEAVVAQIATTCKKLGFPVFIRTDVMSAKLISPYRSVITNESDIVGAAMDLSEAHSNSFGTPSAQAFVVREHLDLVSAFKSRLGKPVTAERRYFIRDGRLECH
ncbi:MAG: hypothetical protein Q7S79_01685, partial [bacterium]|nr:hypothetical protein [bacterium]